MGALDNGLTKGFRFGDEGSQNHERSRYWDLESCKYKKHYWSGNLEIVKISLKSVEAFAFQTFIRNVSVVSKPRVEGCTNEDR